MPWRSVSGLTLSSPHCASCTVIHSCVLCGHRAHLHGELALGHVSGDRDAALDGWAVVSASTTIDVPHPLQALPWGLADPVPPVPTGYGVTRNCTGEGKGF
jgi:hypothetical protein